MRPVYVVGARAGEDPSLEASPNVRTADIPHPAWFGSRIVRTFKTQRLHGTAIYADQARGGFGGQSRHIYIYMAYMECLGEVRSGFRM